MTTRKDVFWKAYLIYFLFLVIMITVIVKTVMIQMEGRKDLFSSTDERLPIRKVERIPRRGEILDANFTPLVTTVTFYDIHMDATVPSQKVFDAEVSDLAKGLANLYPEKTAKEYELMIRTARKRENRYLLIRSKVTNEERKNIQKLPIFRLGRLKGGIIDTDEKLIRKFPHGNMMRRTLGYYRNNKDGELRVGIEGAYNEYLAGENGIEMEQKIATGWRKTGQIVKEAVEGADVITSIDKGIQEVADSELERQLRAQGAKKGCVVVMDVKTGFVKAISNLTINEEGNYVEELNYAIGRKEVPGSTFKLASLMAALEDEKITLTDTVNAYGKYKFYNIEIKDAYEPGYGKITIQRAFEKSSNVISQVIHNAYRKEPEQFVKRLEQFGLTESLGIELVGEPTPTVYKPGSSNWYGTSLASMAIGYEVQQTPLQTLAFFNAVANNGKFVRPLFVKEIRRSGEVIKSFEPYVIKEKICSDKTLALLKGCLEGVMKNGGTGSELTSSQFTIAGKTGTAEILSDNNKYGGKGKEVYQASFVGYFPANEPIYSCIVVISAPSKDIYGAKVSGTVFAAIANKVFASKLKYHAAINESKYKVLSIPQVLNGNKYDFITAFDFLGVKYAITEDDEWLKPVVDSTKVILKRKELGKNTVPDLIGLTAKDAVYIIESRGMVAQIAGFGKVVKQSIPAGTQVYAGGLIELTLN
jgi:cell division protein FtsI (penicillin-binding protein 3)